MTNQVIDFDWDKFQSGAYDVYTKMGQKVSQLTKFNVDFLHEYVGVVNGEIELWFADGIWHTENARSSMDLVLRSKVKECWVNVFEDNGKLIVGQTQFDSKEEAKAFRSHNITYIKTIRITDEPNGQTN